MLVRFLQLAIDYKSVVCVLVMIIIFTYLECFRFKVLYKLQWSNCIWLTCVKLRWMKSKLAGPLLEQSLKNTCYDKGFFVLWFVWGSCSYARVQCSNFQDSNQILFFIHLIYWTFVSFSMIWVRATTNNEYIDFSNITNGRVNFIHDNYTFTLIG